MLQQLLCLAYNAMTHMLLLSTSSGWHVEAGSSSFWQGCHDQGGIVTAPLGAHLWQASAHPTALLEGAQLCMTSVLRHPGFV
jgi:hypothetical protein